MPEQIYEDVTIMTKELRDKLIDHYTRTLDQIRNCYDNGGTVNDINGILHSTNTKNGICYCAISRFVTNIYNCKWVKTVTAKQVCRDMCYDMWAPRPHGSTRESWEIPLMTRIELLHTFTGE